MGRYPRAAREAKIKCMECNAPVTETVDGGYACVDCGRNPLANDPSSGGSSPMDGTDVDGTAPGDGSPLEDEAGPREGSPDEDGTGTGGGSPLDDGTGTDDASVEDDSGPPLGVGQ